MNRARHHRTKHLSLPFCALRPPHTRAAPPTPKRKR